jgi:hypothetical protein
VTFSGGLSIPGVYEARLFLNNSYNVEATDQFTVTGGFPPSATLGIGIWIAKYSSYFGARTPPGDYRMEIEVYWDWGPSFENWWPVQSFTLTTPTGKQFESNFYDLELGLTEPEFENHFIFGDYEISATWLYDGEPRTTTQDFNINSSYQFLDIPYVTSPPPGSVVPPGDITVSWSAVEGATEYYADLSYLE